MSKTVSATINVASNQTPAIAFGIVNEVIDALATIVVTTDVTANGGLTTGNAYVNGIFAASSLATTVIRGGNVQSNAALTIHGNTTFSGTVNAVSFSVNANNLANSSGMYANQFVANSNKLTATSLILNGTTYTTLSTSLQVSFGSNAVGNIANLVFIQGNSTELGVVKNNTANSVEITIGVSANAGLGTAGPNTSVQFNDSGIFGGNVNFTYDKTTQTVTTNNFVASNIAVGNTQLKTVALTYDSVANTRLLDSFTYTDSLGAEYTLFASASASNNRQSSKLLVLYDGGTSALLTEWAVIVANTEVTSYTANANATHVRVYLSPSMNCAVRGLKSWVK